MGMLLLKCSNDVQQGVLRTEQRTAVAGILDHRMPVTLRIDQKLLHPKGSHS